MPSCKYCNQEITWTENNGKNIPMNLDNSQHRCRTKQNNSQQTTIQEDDITQLVRLFEKVLRSVK